MTHVESDPGHDEHIVYSLDPASSRLEKLSRPFPRPMNKVHLESLDCRDYTLEPLGFTFTSDGAFRVCPTEGLAVRATGENPVHSTGRAQGKFALHLEVFPSGKCRLYLWD